MPTVRLRSVEFVGLPGIGKSTVAGALTEQLGPSNVRPRTGSGHRRSTLVALASISITPSLGLRAAHVAWRIVHGVDSDRRPRLRRAWKVFKGLARIATNRRRLLVLDEGPISWMLTPAWRDEASLAKALSALLDLYRAALLGVVHLDGPAGLALQRARDRDSHQPARRGAPGLARTDIGVRARRLDLMTPMIEQRVSTLRIRIDTTDRPEAIAATIIARLGLTAPS